MFTQEERERLSAQADRILAALQTGPQTNSALAGMALQYNARIYELRHKGYNVVCASRDHSTGVSVYELR